MSKQWRVVLAALLLGAVGLPAMDPPGRMPEGKGDHASAGAVPWARWSAQDGPATPRAAASGADGDDGPDHVGYQAGIIVLMGQVLDAALTGIQSPAERKFASRSLLDRLQRHLDSQNHDSRESGDAVTVLRPCPEALVQAEEICRGFLDEILAYGPDPDTDETEASLRHYLREELAQRLGVDGKPAPRDFSMEGLSLDERKA